MDGAMDDGMLRSIYSAADETIDALDRLLFPVRDREREARMLLRDATARLGETSAPYLDDDSAWEPPAAKTTPRPTRSVAPETPYVALPQRTTHGGPFGPSVRQKLIAEALAKRSVW